MQTINKTVQCSECGCIAFPDATYCPKCGASYRNNKTQKQIAEKLQNIVDFSTPDTFNANQSILEACCQFICPHHGQINIRTTISIPSAKCPLC
jgi:hypothetical protein